MLLYGINSIVFCMIKGHLEIVCRTKFHMSVGKTKFYAMKLACACIVIIILLICASKTRDFSREIRTRLENVI